MVSSLKYSQHQTIILRVAIFEKGITNKVIDEQRNQSQFHPPLQNVGLSVSKKGLGLEGLSISSASDSSRTPLQSKVTVNVFTTQQ